MLCGVEPTRVEQRPLLVTDAELAAAFQMKVAGFYAGAR
jgi:hypothetical protein